MLRVRLDHASSVCGGHMGQTVWLTGGHVASTAGFKLMLLNVR